MSDMQQRAGEKFSKPYFLDLSDYGRPCARAIVDILEPTRVTPIHVSLAFTAVGLSAALMIAAEVAVLVPALLLPVKSILDAADGQLARRRQRPSYVGRYLDSVCDFFVSVGLFAGLAFNAGLPFWLAAVALLLQTFQATCVHYFQVHGRRLLAGSDTTSRVNERALPELPSYDNPFLAQLFHRLYLIIYDWQESSLRRLFPVSSLSQIPPWFLTALSALGLGAQLLWMSLLFVVLGAEAVMCFFVGPASLYLVALLGCYRLVLAERNSSQSELQPLGGQEHT